MTSASPSAFSPAFVDERGLVRFEAQTIDWRALATPARVGFDPTRPSPADLERLRSLADVSGNAEVVYLASLPSAMRSRRYSLISAGGIEHLRPDRLEGVVRFTLADNVGNEIAATAFFGMVLSTASGPGEGGFVLSSPSSQCPRRVAGATVELLRIRDQHVLAYTDERGSLSARLPTPWFERIRSAYAFELAGERFVFVAWPADESGSVEAYLRR